MPGLPEWRVPARRLPDRSPPDVAIGIFGGSFDPVHHGHLIVAQTLVERIGLDHVRLLVAQHQPLKAGRHAASGEHRAAMLELAVRGASRLRVDRTELARPGPSYTVETLARLTQAEPEADWVLLLGADAAAEFAKWKAPEVIRSRVSRLVAFSRGGVTAPGGFDHVDVPHVEISSTGIRARVRAGRSIRYWVPDAVADYIAAHRLYREDEA